jgi:acetoin:2,6-dichlorophenolindophenol oxidoreductase subunit alpha
MRARTIAGMHRAAMGKCPLRQPRWAANRPAAASPGPAKNPFPPLRIHAKLPDQRIPPTAPVNPLTTAPTEKHASRGSFLAAFRHMLTARLLEDRLAALYRAGGKIVGGVYLGRGQEAFSAALAVQLQKGRDIYAGLIRDQAGRLAFGEPILDTTRTYLGSALGPMRGRDGNIHHGRPKEGMPAMISHLGSTISVVAGMLLARRLQGRLADAVGAACMGDGATSTGAFHEGLNMAAVEKLPLVIAIANNQFAYSTPTSRQFACADLVERARGYGVEGHSVDGTNLAACLDVFQTAVERARQGHGPQMVVGSLLRLSGHGEHDDASYIPPALRKSDLGRDCLPLAEQTLRANRWLDESAFATLRAEVLQEIDQAFSQTMQEPEPDPYKETWSSFATPALGEGWQVR